MGTTTINEGSAVSRSASSLALTYSNLREAVARYLDYEDPTTPGDWTTDESSRVERAIEDGLRRFYAEHRWTFLKRSDTISLVSGTADYNLQPDFAELIGMPTVTGTGKVDVLDMDELRALQDGDDQTGVPRYCAVELRTPDATAGSRYQLSTYPTASASGTLRYRYRMEPDMIDSTNTYPYGGAVHADTIKEACLAAAESLDMHAAPQPAAAAQLAAHEQRYQIALARSLRADMGATTLPQTEKGAKDGMADQ